MIARIRFAACALALGLSLTAAASATTLVRLSLDQLTQASTDVLQGRVVSQVSQWNAAHTEILTFTTLSVDQNIKGNTPSTIVVQQLGGAVGNLHVSVPGTVHFFPAAKYELFLQHAPSRASNYLLVGMLQGAYRIYRDPGTRQERVISPTSYFYHASPAGSGGPKPTPSSATMPLNEFQQQVYTDLQKPISIPAGARIPLVVRSVSFSGVGRILIEAQTVGDLYPIRNMVIPARSMVDGWGAE
ncbi:MAG: hypothetical protein ACRD10_08240, partial [Terriglobia bacterium]